MWAGTCHGQSNAHAGPLASSCVRKSYLLQETWKAGWEDIARVLKICRRDEGCCALTGALIVDLDRSSASIPGGSCQSARV